MENATKTFSKCQKQKTNLLTERQFISFTFEKQRSTHQSVAGFKYLPHHILEEIKSTNARNANKGMKNEHVKS